MDKTSEEKRVSKLVKQILEHSHNMFKEHMMHEQHEEAISIGDEYLEWIKDIDAEEIFYYNQHDIEELYRSLRRQRRKRKPHN